MQAGTLLASPDQPASAASGLLALTELGQADLAVALLVDLWSVERHQVSTETAILVIDAALRSKTKPKAQLVGAELLCRNAMRLNSGQSLHWPSVIDGGWDPQFAPKTKFLLLEALLMSTTRPMDRNSLRSVAVRLYGIWSIDPDPNVKGCVGTVLCELIGALESLRYTDFMQGRDGDPPAAAGGRGQQETERGPVPRAGRGGAPGAAGGVGEGRDRPAARCAGGDRADGHAVSAAGGTRPTPTSR